jgi:hypothetical protein
MDEEAQAGGRSRGEPKIDLVTGIGITLAMGTLDILDIIPFVGDFTTLPAYMVNFYLYTKGINGTLFAVTNTLGFIPIIQDFPCKTIGWLATWGIDQFAPPIVAVTLEQVGEKMEGKAEGVAGATEGAATGAAGTAAKGTGERVATMEAEKAAEGAGGIAQGTAATGAQAASGVEGAAQEAGTTEKSAAQRGSSAEAGTEGTEEESGKKGIEPEAFGQERELLGTKEGQPGRLEKELLEETPKPQKKDLI